MKHQLETQLGIFACDGYAVFTDNSVPWTVGGGPLGLVVAQTFPHAEVGTSVDGTAGNARLFMNLWDTVIVDGHWGNHDWIVKVDPDAMLIPDKLRQHVKDHNGQNVWIANCNAWPSSPNFPMMYGAIEVISHSALAAYQSDAQGEQKCREWLDWRKMGEDLWLGKCLDILGVQKVGDFQMVLDQRCVGYTKCEQNQPFAAYHPFKDVNSWMGCLNNALGRR
jgi:hypothetical protein